MIVIITLLFDLLHYRSIIILPVDSLHYRSIITSPVDYITGRLSSVESGAYADMGNKKIGEDATYGDGKTGHQWGRYTRRTGMEEQHITEQVITRIKGL